MANPKSAYSVSTKKEKTDTHIIVVWVGNEAGVLARVVGLFSGRGLYQKIVLQLLLKHLLRYQPKLQLYECLFFLFL